MSRRGELATQPGQRLRSKEEVIQDGYAAKKFLVQRAGSLRRLSPNQLAPKPLRHHGDADEHAQPHAFVAARRIVQCRMHREEIEHEMVAPSPAGPGIPPPDKVPRSGSLQPSL